MTQDNKGPKNSKKPNSGSKTPPESPADPAGDRDEDPLGASSTPLRLEYLDPRELQAHPGNFRQHGGRQRQAMADIIEEVGMITGVVYNEQTGHIIDGHMRVQEFIEQNAERIPVVICSLTEEQETKALLFFDRVAAMAGIDREKELILARVADAEADSLNSLIAEARGGLASTEDPEDPTLGEGPEDRYGVGLVPGEGFHYVVLLFRTELDWYAATDHFQLQRQQDAFRPSLQKLQVVVDGGKYLERIRGDQRE
ncbi:MAG: hypothetical protein H8E48_06670 [Chloroflexi bacterium]|nr:hypothetical protein [Chloroflexota bacterium]